VDEAPVGERGKTRWPVVMSYPDITCTLRAHCAGRTSIDQPSVLRFNLNLGFTSHRTSGCQQCDAILDARDAPHHEVLR